MSPGASPADEWTHGISRWRYWLPWVFAALGVTFSLALWLGMQYLHKRLQRSEFQALARQRVGAVERELMTVLNFVEFAAPVYASAARELRAEQQHPQPMMPTGHFGVAALLWAPKSLDLPADVVLNAAERLSLGDRFPVRNVFSVTGPPHADYVGYDLAADSAAVQAISYAREQRHPAVAAGGLRSRTEPHLLLAVPIYVETPMPGSEPPELSGIVMGVVDVAVVVTRAMTSWNDKFTRITLYQRKGPVEEELVFASLPLPQGSDDTATHVPPVAQTVLLHGQPWAIRATPTRDYYLGSRSFIPLSCLILGLTMTAAGTSYILRLTHRATHVERLVVSRTNELEQSYTELQRHSAQRQQAEDALGELRAAYHSLIESLPLNCFRKDLEGRIVSANQLFCQTVGCSLDELLNKTDFDLYHHAQAQKFRSDDAQVIRNGHVLEKIEEHITPHGEKLYVQVLKAPIRDAKGDIVGVQGMFWDVSHRIRLEEARRQSDARFRQLINSSLLGVMIANLDGRILEANQALLTMLGYEPDDQTAGRLRWDDVTPEEYRQLDIQAIDTLKRDRTCPPWEKEYIHRQGHRVPVLIGVTMLDSSDDECICFVLDMSQRKEMEEQLIAARDAADAASRAKSQFLVNMSHEIRTPMNSVISMIELALNTELTPQQREYLHLALRSGETLLEIIDEILDVSKVEAGKLVLESRTFNLSEAIGDTMKTMALRAHAKQLEIACDIDPQLPHVLVGDVGRLRQVIVNLVSNALKFTERGEIVLTARLVAELDDRVEIRFAVRDTGIGIPEDKRELIFHAFEQADTATTRRYGGTGLGLAIARRLIELMGGSIGVESTVGAGSTFYFTALFGRGSAEDVAAEKKLARFNVNTMRVLVADDHATTRQILLHMLDNWGIEALAACSAAEAFATLQANASAQRPFRILIGDANMLNSAESNWIERLHDVHPADIRVILLTAADGGPSPNELPGITARLIKPVEQSELFDALMNAVTAGEQPASVPVREGELSARSTGSLHILLAEDNPINQTVACELLQMQGHRVTIAHNGCQAVELVRQHCFDVVIMDVQMPDMDGLAATQTIRAWEQDQGRPRLPIVAMTAHAMRGDRQRCLAAGMDEYVAKPVRAKELFAVLARIKPSQNSSGPPSTPANASDAGERETAAAADENLKDANAANEAGSSSESSAADPAAVPSDSAAGESAPHGGRIAWQDALDMVNGKASLLRELVTLFLSEGPLLLGRAQQAVTDGDTAALRMAAHTLKGSARYFGTNNVAELSYALEKMASQGHIDESAKECCGQLVQALDDMLVECRGFLEQDSSTEQQS